MDEKKYFIVIEEIHNIQLETFGLVSKLSLYFLSHLSAYTEIVRGVDEYFNVLIFVWL